MKKFILAAIGVIFTSLVAMSAVTSLQRFSPGFALQDGNKLNTIVDAVNVINSAQAVFGGEIALDGSNPTPVTTGLSSINGCTVSLKYTTAPAITSTNIVTYGRSGGTLNIYGWTYTTLSNATLIASTALDTVGWECTGTK